MSRLNRSHWQLLAALHELGTISAAAEAVFITQSAATQRLREAERRLGVPLVERTGKSLRLNRSGQRIAATGRDLEARLMSAEADAVWLGRNEGERLRVLQPAYDDQAWLTAFAARLRAEHPATEVELVRSGAAEGMRMLARGDADVALLPNQAPYPGVTATALFEDRLVALVPPGDPLASRPALTPADLAPRTYLTYGYVPQSGFEFERFFRPAEVYPARIVRIESTATIVSLISAGLGVSILARWATADAAESGRIVHVPLTGEAISITWHLLTSAAIDSAPARRAVAYLRAFLQESDLP